MKTVDEIADELEGTCTFLSTILEKYEMEEKEDDIQWLGQLDDRIFCCEFCNWWYSLSEVAHEGQSQGICFECFEEGD